MSTHRCPRPSPIARLPFLPTALGWAGFVSLFTACGGGPASDPVSPEDTASAITGSPIRAIAVSEEDNGCFVTGDTGAVYCWEGVYNSKVFVLDPSSDQSPYFPGNKTSWFAPEHVALPKQARTIAVGNYSACAVLTDSTVWCWGSNEFGQLGLKGPAGGSSKPIQIVFPGTIDLPDGVPLLAKNVAGSVHHYCAATTFGGAVCWGANESGQLGNGTTTQSAALVTPTGLGSYTGVTTVAAGQEHSCAILSDETAKCWGDNWAGELGDGNKYWSHTPVSVLGLDSPVAITAGAYSTCALQKNGAVYCWGDNEYGQLGIGTTTPANGPVVWSKPQAVHNWFPSYTAVSEGAYLTCELNGPSAYCWGSELIPYPGWTTPTFFPTIDAGVSVIAAGFGQACWGSTTGNVGCMDMDGSGTVHTVL